MLYPNDAKIDTKAIIYICIRFENIFIVVNSGYSLMVELIFISSLNLSVFSNFRIISSKLL